MGDARQLAATAIVAGLPAGGYVTGQTIAVDGGSRLPTVRPTALTNRAANTVRRRLNCDQTQPAPGIWLPTLQAKSQLVRCRPADPGRATESAVVDIDSHRGNAVVAGRGRYRPGSADAPGE